MTLPPIDTAPEEVPVLYTEEAGVARITLNRPQRKNAMTPAMDIALRQAFLRARASATCRVILLTGAGGSFCSGADLSAAKSTAEPPWDMVPASWDRFRFSYLLDTEQPVVAAVPGYAIGVGLVIACLADIRLAEPTSQLSFPYARLGLVAEYGIASVLADIIGPARAADLLLRGDRISGEQAAAIGLVHRLASATELEEQSWDYAHALSTQCSPASLRVIKKQLWSTRRRDLLAAVQADGRALESARDAADFREARAAFNERRAPVFADLPPGTVR